MSVIFAIILIQMFYDLAGYLEAKANQRNFQGLSIYSLKCLNTNVAFGVQLILMTKLELKVAIKPTSEELRDVEDIGSSSGGVEANIRPMVTSKRKRVTSGAGDELDKNWREILGPPPPMGRPGEEREIWIRYHKRKWTIQMKQREARRHRESVMDGAPTSTAFGGHAGAGGAGVLRTNLGGFLRRAQQTLLSSMWQILQVMPTTLPGLFRLWVLVGTELHQIRLTVPRVFYLNKKKPLDKDFGSGSAAVWRKVNRILPRSHRVYHLYEYRHVFIISFKAYIIAIIIKIFVLHISVPEEIYQQNFNQLMADLSTSDNAGIYETQVQ